MSFLYPSLLSRIFNILLIGGLILFLSCQSDPIVLNPPGGYEYLKKSFSLNTESSKSIQGDLHTGMSPRLYSGILTSGDTVSTLIQLLPQILDSHHVCSTDSIADVRVVLTSTTPIAMKEDTTFIDTFIQLNAIKAYLILSPQINEDAVIESNDLNFLDSELISEETSMSVELKTDYNLEINLFDQNNNIIDSLCNEQEKIGILISYLPNDSSHLEFYSSDGAEINIGPRLSVKYTVEEDIPRNYNRYSFKEVTWSDELMNNFGPYYVNDTLSGYWGTFYAMDLSLNDPIISNPPLNYDSITVQADIIPQSHTSPITLLQIKVDLISEIMDSIAFSLTNVFAFISDLDPAGDNVGTHPDSTENNLAYDEGEKFNNYGLDNCPDELEDGEGGCADLEEESLYNKGTEGNKQRDWIDNNGNGKWDVGEGEMWGDWGIDWCPDSLETGAEEPCKVGLPCNCSSNPNPALGYDPNGDNVDPAGDDWHEINNPESTEGNHKWDSGEPFYDWGSDGLPISLLGDPDENHSEGNGNYDIGEPFEDTGSDGLFNIDEFGYNVDRTEGNNQFDGEGEFYDCGEDNICNGTEGDDETDDYNIDPNNDNWSVEDSTGTEGNDQLDLINGSSEGLWVDGDGEEWFDWGLDGIPDYLEAFQVATVIVPNLYNNSYLFDINEGLLQQSPELVDSMVNLWISKIEKTGNNELIIDISIQSNVALKGLQFQLFHTPFTKVETEFQPYETSIGKIGTEKLFEDLTLYPKEYFSEKELEGKLLIDFANDVSTFLDFDSLNFFLANNEYIFSHQYSNLVMYVDSASTNMQDDYIYVNVIHSNSSGEEIILLQKPVLTSSDSIEIKMGQILRSYQNGSIDTYNGLKLMIDGNQNNYSKLSIQYNPEQINYSPRLNLIYTK